VSLLQEQLDSWVPQSSESWSTRAIMLDKTDATRLLTKIRRQWFAKRKSIAAILKEVMTNETSTLLDTDAHNKAIDADAALQELGSDAIGQAFKTPDLRNILLTGPYFHDGSMQTLWDVMDHYNKGDGVSDPWLDEDMQPLALTESEIDDVVAFLASLTSPQYKNVGDQEYARQLALSKVDRPQRDTARAFGPKPSQPKRPPF